MYVPARPAAPFEMGASTDSLRVRSPGSLDHQRYRAERLNSLKASLGLADDDTATGGLADDDVHGLDDDDDVGFWRGVQSSQYWEVGDSHSSETRTKSFFSENTKLCRLALARATAQTKTGRQSAW